MTQKQFFEYTTEIDTEDGEGTEKVTFKLRPFNKMPSGILRRNRNNPEGQMWDSFQWGLSEDQLDAFDRLPVAELEELLELWSDAAQGDQDKPTGRPKTPAVDE